MRVEVAPPGTLSDEEMPGERRRRNVELDMDMEEGGAILGDTQPLIANGIDSEERNEKAYESLLNQVGFGKFQILLLLVCGWANASGD